MSREPWTEEETQELYAVLMTKPKNLSVVGDALEKKRGFRRSPGALSVILGPLARIKAFEVTEEMRSDLRKASKGKKKTALVQNKARATSPAVEETAVEEVPPEGWLIISKACALVNKNQHWIRSRAEKGLIAVHMFNGCMHFKKEDLLRVMDAAAAEDKKAKTREEAFAGQRCSPAAQVLAWLDRAVLVPREDRAQVPRWSVLLPTRRRRGHAQADPWPESSTQGREGGPQSGCAG
jgi:hypothetical protein